MDKYQSIISKIAVLEKKAAALRDTEKQRVISRIQAQIKTYDIQPDDLFSNDNVVVNKPSVGTTLTGRKRKAGKSVAAKRKSGKPPKYRDPVSGKTWNGHGKPPAWLAGVSDRQRFLIASQTETES